MKRLYLFFSLALMVCAVRAQTIIQSSSIVEYDIIDTVTTPTSPRSSIRYERSTGYLFVYNHTTGDWVAYSSGGGGGAAQLSDLSDVNTSTPTDKNVLVADGVDFESRALLLSDISNLVADHGDILVISSTEWEVDVDAIGTDQIEDNAVTAAKIGTGEVGADELAATTVTAGSYTNGNFTVDADGRITAASNGSGSAPAVDVVTADGGRDTIDFNSTYERIIQFNMGAVTRADSVVLLNPSEGGSYLIHCTSCAADTLTFLQSVLDSHGDEIGSRAFTTTTANIFSMYYDGANYYVVQPPGITATLPEVTYDSDYQALLDYATTQGYTLPGPSARQSGSDLITDLKAAGTWASLDAFYVFASGSSDENFALLNWKTPGTNSAAKVGTGITYSTTGGFTTNGTTGYINTNFQPSTDGSNFTQNSAGMGYYVSSGQGGMGGQDGGSVQASLRIDNGIQFSLILNSSSGGQLAFADVGPYGNSIFGFRSASNSLAIHEDGSSISTGSGASSGLCAVNVFVGARNNNGTPDVGRTAEFSIVFFSNNQSANSAAIHTAFSTYIGSL